MSKLYGVHDSFCSLVSPGKEGDLKRCTCNSGKVGSIEVREIEEWEAKAKAYAGGAVDGLVKKLGPGTVTVAYKEAMYNFFMRAWKESHPRVTLVEASREAPAVAAPVAAEDTGFALANGGSGGGPGEKGEGWLDRVSHDPLHCQKPAGGPCTCGAEWLARTRRSMEADGISLQSVQHPIAPKQDAGKAKIFQFFLQQFPLGMIELARHMENGCRDPGHVFLGWQEVDNGFSRYSDAMMRHLLEEIIATVTGIDREEGVDKAWVEETHAVATAANALIRLELLLRKRRNLNLDERSGA